MTLTAIFAVVNLELVVRGNSGEFNWVVYLLCVPFLAGGFLALYFRPAKPNVYRNLGQAERVLEILAIRREGAEPSFDHCDKKSAQHG